MEKSFDAAIVIPSHREDTDVIHTLASIARQKGLKGREIGVIVVVNNVRGAVQEVLDENRATAELVRALNRREIPDSLSDQRKQILSFNPGFESFGHVSISDKEAAEQVLQAPFLHLSELDLWEGDHAPEVCNVGVARDIGTREGIAHVKNESCPIMHRDADTLLHPYNVATVLDVFERRPDIKMLRGTLYEFLPADRSAEGLAQKRQRYCEHLDRLITTYQTMLFEERSRIFERDVMKLTRMGMKRPIKKVAISLDKGGEIDADGNVTVKKLSEGVNGCDMNFRASLYDEVQFPHIPGEEDTRFAASVEEKGHTLEFDPRLKAAARVRFSQRATTGHGRMFLRFSGSDFASHPHTSLKRQELFIDLHDLVLQRMQVWPTHDLFDFTKVLEQHGIISRYGLTPDDLRTLFTDCIHREGGQIGLTGGVHAFSAKKFPSTVCEVLADLKVKLQNRTGNKEARRLLAAVQRHESLLHALDSENIAS